MFLQSYQLDFIHVSSFLFNSYCITDIASIYMFGRETNKAFCGFLDQSKYSQYKRLFKMNSVQVGLIKDNEHNGDISRDEILARLFYHLTSIVFIP